MSKKRIKAGSVDELMEIVRAIQNGEEPEEMLRRKQEAEREAQLQEEKKRSEMLHRKKKEKKAAKNSATFSEAEEKQEDLLETSSSEEKGTKKVPESGKKEERTVESSEPEEKEKRTVKSSEPEKKEKRTVKSSEPEKKEKRTVKSSEPEKKEKRATKSSKSVWDDEDFDDDEFDRLLDEDDRRSEDVRAVFLKMKSGVQGLWKSLKSSAAKTVANKEKTEKPEDTADIQTSSEKKDVDVANSVPLPEKQKPELKPGKEHPVSGWLKDQKNVLARKGIQRRELVMIVSGAFLAVILILLVINGIRGVLEEKSKSRNVTADEGFLVLVEDEPEEWSKEYPVQLKLKVKGAEITGVTVNGQKISVDEKGLLTAVISENSLEVAAETSQGTKTAQVQISKIDHVPPVIQIAREQDQILVTGADAHSDISGIWYAAVKDTDYQQLPFYQKYEGALTFEENTLYYFYAEDQAGNCSIPVVTTTEEVRELVLDSAELSLYPGEEVSLGVASQPENALVNNLRFESANADVVTVDSTGKLTAVGEGTTLVNVLADGVPGVSCSVAVSEQHQVTISAVGDCTLGTDAAFNVNTNFDAFYAVQGSDYFFRNVKDILANDDATFANFEGTLTNQTTREQKEFAFKGDPAYAGLLEKASIDVVTLANNHSHDYGTQSLTDTQAALEEAGISCCNDDTIAIKETAGILTAFVGIYVLNDGYGCEDRVRSSIAEAKDRGAQLIIVGFHWGSEKAQSPDDIQQYLAHAAVDCGADLVVGHHPHVLQGIEKYNGKYIVYSLGNFCFGGNSYPSDMDTIIFRQTFTVTKQGILDNDQIEIIPCRISSEDGYNNFQPTPAQGSSSDRIIQKLNERSSSFGLSFTASDGLA